MGGVKMAGTNFQSLILPHHPSSSRTLATIYSSLSSAAHNTKTLALAHPRRSPFLGAASTNLSRTTSLDDLSGRARGRSEHHVLRRASSAPSLDEDGDNRQLDGLAFKLRHSTSVRPEPPDWLSHPDEMKASSVHQPVTMKQRKKNEQKQVPGGQSAQPDCGGSVNRAFSSMVFIVRELRSFTLQTRVCENLEARVHGESEMNASFVWLFHHVFSSTPTLMLSLMLLLSHFSLSSLPSSSSPPTLVAPVSVELEHDGCSGCLQTELMYIKALAQDPDNILLLSNFAQFLFLALRDHDRAERCFKRAAGVRPADAEAWNRYANFLWVARHDLGAAEEAYLEAVAAEPDNSYYAASYAHFLWNTGGDDTCYPLDVGDAV